MHPSGNTIIVTGGGSGIGRGLAAAFHASGNTVIIAGRTRAALDATAAGYPGMQVRALDAADPVSIAAFAESVVRDFPAANVLVNNAGMMRIEDLLADPVGVADAETTIATNLLGPIRLTAALLPHLRRQPSATVINVTSGLAFVPLAATPAYNATKAGLHSWSQSLRHQLRETSVGVIEILPPAVATDLLPGHAANPTSMPLDAFIAETMMLLRDHPEAHENGVERVQLLRRAEAGGRYDEVFAMLNGAH